MGERARTKTGGAFENGEQMSFIATNVGNMKAAMELDLHKHVLVPLDQVSITAGHVNDIRRAARQGFKILLDSGVYSMTANYARATGKLIEYAHLQPPETFSEWPVLRRKYEAVVGDLGDELWGYIELDQGTAEQKTKTRLELEAAGLHPIPVYHPASDTPEYFQKLLAEYDRVCVGGLAITGGPAVRRRVMATVWERRQAYPDTWVHLLGVSLLTPEVLAYPPDSIDSSSWTTLSRWAKAFRPMSLSGGLAGTGEEMRYSYNAEADAVDGSGKARHLGMYEDYMMERSWRNYTTTLLGGDNG